MTFNPNWLRARLLDYTFSSDENGHRDTPDTREEMVQALEAKGFVCARGTMSEDDGIHVGAKETCWHTVEEKRVSFERAESFSFSVVAFPASFLMWIGAELANPDSRVGYFTK